MRKIRLLLFVLLSIGLASCNEVIVEVTRIPENTPKENKLYLTGNFNFWDPADPAYELASDGKGKYYTKIPLGWGTVIYKVTRGEWRTVEEDACGYYIPNRALVYNQKDTVKIQVESWDDLGPTHCDRVTMVVKPPHTTKMDDHIFVAGSFNNWHFGENYRLMRQANGTYHITLQKLGSEIEFKFAKGSWASEELDAFGNLVPNHKFYFGKKDTFHIDIPQWKSRINDYSKNVVFNLMVPQNTADTETVYMSGTFNNWKTDDPRYKFNKIKKGIYSTTVPRNITKNMVFKFCKGNWEKGELDENGIIMGDRKLTVGYADTVWLEVKAWRDTYGKH